MPLKETIFTKEQDNFIIDNYGKKTAKEIALSINKEVYNVQRRAKKLGVWVSGTERKWTQEEDSYLKENYGNFNAREIGLKLNRGYDAVKKRAKTLNITEEADEKWTDEELALLVKQYGKISYKEMIKQYFPNRNISGLEHKASRLKLTEGHYQVVNHNFFSDPNLLNSYIAGFIAADGCVLDSRPSLIINLNEKDGEYLQNIVNNFTDGKLKYKYSKNYHKNEKWNFDGSNICKITINSSKIIEDLRNKFNIVPRKSLIYQPPVNLSLENSLAFIVGNIDGDGSVKFISHKPKQNNKEYIYKSITLQLLGTKNYLEWVKKIFNNYIDLSKTNIYSTKNIFRLNINGKKAIILYKILNSVNVPKLQRKWANPKLLQVPGLE